MAGVKGMKGGGKREGAGRPKKYGETLKRIMFNIPESKVPEVTTLVNEKLKTYLKNEK